MISEPFGRSAAMEFGSFMEFPPISAQGAASGDSAAFDRALDEVETAERVGLDAIWLAELHGAPERSVLRSEEHTSELQSQSNLVCRLLLEKKTPTTTTPYCRDQRRTSPRHRT